MTSHEHPNVAIAREGMQASERGDQKWLEDHLDDNVSWHVGGNSAAAGTLEGKEQVLHFFGGMGQGGGGMKLDLHDIMATDDHTVVLGTAHLSAPDGDSVDYNFVNVFHIRDGKVTEAWGMTENDAVTDAFFEKLANQSNTT
jgi:ketosteroid isomerase-like protein